MYKYRTPAGDFQIRLRRGRWHIIYRGLSLGVYKEPDKAAWALAKEGVLQKTPGLDPESTYVPWDLTEWEYVPEPGLVKERVLH